MVKAEVIVTAMIIKVMDNVMISTTTMIVIATELVAKEIDVSMMMTATTMVRVDIVILVVLGVVITTTVAVDMVAIVGVIITTMTDSTLREITSLATHREQMGGAISRIPTVHNLMQHPPIICRPLMNYCKSSFSCIYLFSQLIVYDASESSPFFPVYCRQPLALCHTGAPVCYQTIFLLVFYKVCY